jgi:hypothetical protein
VVFPHHAREGRVKDNIDGSLSFSEHHLCYENAAFSKNEGLKEI